MTYLTLDPWTRVNEIWVDPTINCCPISESYKDPLIQGHKNLLAYRFQADFYKNIAVDIVTETVYNYPYPFITEKTLRPISCKRMFILVAAPGVLELLHAKGFQTFSNFIDESYDTEKDPVKRWYLICQAIEQFVTKPLDEIKSIVNKCAPILEHNFRTLVELESKECKQINDTNP